MQLIPITPTGKGPVDRFSGDVTRDGTVIRARAGETDWLEPVAEETYLATTWSGAHPVVVYRIQLPAFPLIASHQARTHL